MFRNLNTGAIGIRASLSETLEIAQTHGFGGVDFSILEVFDMVKVASVSEINELFLRNGCRPGSWGLPVSWYGEEQKWREDLDWLRQYAALAQEIDALRTTAVVLPFSDELAYEDNYSLHVERLKPVSEVLHDYGCSLGLEFIGPKTLRNKKHEFLHTMDEALQLGADLGPNVGLLLDHWHLYTSQGTIENVRRLSGRQVVAVHVNDAPAGVPVDEQVDNVRCLPGETGVLDTAAFLKALNTIGYNGPVTVEPFNTRVNEMEDWDAVRVTAKSLQKTWMEADL